MARLEFEVDCDIYKTHYRHLVEEYVEDDEAWPNI